MLSRKSTPVHVEIRFPIKRQKRRKIIEGCPFRELCTKSEYGRIIQRNENWISQKTKVKELLATDEYKSLMKKRSTECETVFGQTKANLHFRRFHLRSKEKVGIEWGLLMIGYDFKQLARMMKA